MHKTFKEKKFFVERKRISNLTLIPKTNASQAQQQFNKINIRYMKIKSSQIVIDCKTFVVSRKFEWKKEK